MIATYDTPLARLCKQANLSTAAVAEKAGVERETARLWLIGRSVPRPRHAKVLARLLGIEVGTVYALATDGLAHQEEEPVPAPRPRRTRKAGAAS